MTNMYWQTDFIKKNKKTITINKLISKCFKVCCLSFIVDFSSTNKTLL